jgi:hypothetical protein
MIKYQPEAVIRDCQFCKTPVPLFPADFPLAVSVQFVADCGSVCKNFRHTINTVGSGREDL